VTIAAILVCILCQLCLVGGQIMLKHAMNAAGVDAASRTALVVRFAGAIGLMTAWFFLWLALLKDWDLSTVYPFEGLSPLLMVLGAWIFLNERITPRGWAGVILIGAGIALVSQGQ
jgi:drug/metabolite transporter (DMT)-like permease